METLSPKQAQELLEYITILVLGGDSDTPIEAINKLSEISEQEN